MLHYFTYIFHICYISYMKYSEKTPDNLSNSDVIVLLVLQKYPLSSGYKIRQVIRKYVSDLVFRPGQTSIYMSLNTLRHFDFVSQALHHLKSGKGPIPYLYKLTSQGERVLKNNLIHRLSNCDMPYDDFDIGLNGIDVLTEREYISALELRRLSLLSRAQQILGCFESLSEAPLSTTIMLQRQLVSLQADISFTERLLSSMSDSELLADRLFI